MKGFIFILWAMTLCAFLAMGVMLHDALIGVQTAIYTLASVESARFNKECGFKQKLGEGWAEIEMMNTGKTENIYFVTSGGWKEGGK